MVLPDDVALLFWDIDVGTLDLDRHRDYVLERVMARGNWTAMKWLRAQYPEDQIAGFLQRRGSHLPPRERAYWSLVSNAGLPSEPGGGRPSWAG